MRAGKSFLSRVTLNPHWFKIGHGWGQKKICPTSKLVNNEDLQREVRKTASFIPSHFRTELQDKIELDYIIRKYPEDLGTVGQRFVCPSIPSNLLLACRSLFNDQKTADVQFVFHRKTGRRVEYIYAHSIILSTSSEYFRTSTFFSTCLFAFVDFTF
jgi:hypothetical protein